MRLGIKSKQVIGVTSIVAAVVVALSLLNLARLAQVSLEESQARAELLADAIYHRARDLVGAADPVAALAGDPGLRAILESSLYSKNVVFAAIADVNGVAVADSDRSQEGRRLPPGGDLGALVSRSGAVRAAVHLLGPGAHARVPAAAAARRPRVRLDSRRRLDAAHPARPRPVAHAGDRHGVRRAGHRRLHRDAAGAAAAASDPRHPQRPHAPRPRRVRRPARSRIGTTSSASWARTSTPSATAWRPSRPRRGRRSTRPPANRRPCATRASSPRSGVCRPASRMRSRIR